VPGCTTEREPVPDAPEWLAVEQHACQNGATCRMCNVMCGWSKHYPAPSPPPGCCQAACAMLSVVGPRPCPALFPRTPPNWCSHHSSLLPTHSRHRTVHVFRRPIRSGEGFACTNFSYMTSRECRMLQGEECKSTFVNWQGSTGHFTWHCQRDYPHGWILSTTLRPWKEISPTETSFNKQKPSHQENPTSRGFLNLKWESLYRPFTGLRPVNINPAAGETLFHVDYKP
jgi:hypothetical protein